MNKHTLLFSILLILSTILKLINLNYPPEYYFDEVYTSFTAASISEKNSTQIWLPADKPVDPPRGYEWAHPPLARIIIAATLKILGNQPWIWRLPSVVFGSLSILLLSLLGKNIFSEKIGLLAAYLFAFDGLSFAQSRIGMTDSILIFFILLSLYLSLENSKVFSFIATGLAISTKWIAVILLPIIFIKHCLFLKNKQKPFFQVFLLALVVIFTVYIFSYLPYFSLGNNISDFFSLQLNIIKHNFSGNLIHPSQSPWYLWPIGYKPIPLFIDKGKQIWAVPNYFIFCLGLVAITTIVYKLAKHKIEVKDSKKLILLLLCYLLFLTPWILTQSSLLLQRPTYLYYYLPCLPFMHLISAYWLNGLLIKRRTTKFTLAFSTLIATFIIFIYIYPKLVGL